MEIQNEWVRDAQQAARAAQQMAEPDPVVSSISDLIQYLLRKKMLIIGFVGILVALTILWGLTLMPASYQATEKLYINTGNSSIVDLSDLQLGSSLSEEYSYVFRNKEIHETIRQKLHLEYTDEELDGMISTSNPMGRILSVTVSSMNSEYEALRLVEEYCNEASAFIEDRMGGRIPAVFEKAMITEYHRGLTVKVLLAALIGGIVIVLALSAHRLLSDRICERKYVERDAGVRILGVVPGKKTGKKTRKAAK